MLRTAKFVSMGTAMEGVGFAAQMARQTAAAVEARRGPLGHPEMLATSSAVFTKSVLLGGEGLSWKG